MNQDTPRIEEVLSRLDRIEAALVTLVERQTVKEWYTTEEVGKLLGKSEYTVREWCRQGRIRGEKKGSGRGKYQSWVVSHAELLRVQKEGILPPPVG
jgi:excisionase family DNA binding protein